MMKTSYRMESVETISPLNVTTPYKRYKSISNFPCVHGVRPHYKRKQRKNSKFTKTEDLDINHKNERQNDATLLECPSCGWEDIKLDNTAVLHPEYSNFVDELYEEYNAHRIADTMYKKRNNNIIPCPSFPSNLPSYTSYPADELTTHTYYPQDIYNYTNQQMTPELIVTPKLNSCTRETQLLSEQLFPEKRTKQVGPSVEQHDKGIQNTVCMSKMETDVVRKCCRGVQRKSLTSQEELQEVAVNTTQQCDKKIQNTICASLSNCQASQKYFLTQETKQIDANTPECSVNDMQNMIEVDKTHLALNDKKLVENEICIKETCFRDIMEIIKQNSAVTQGLLRCLERVMQEKTKIYSATSLLSKRDNINFNSSEIITCEQIPSNFTNENTDFGISSIELESPSCLPCLEKTEEDNVVEMFTKIFLELMKHALELNSKNVQKGCVRKEDAINTFIVLNKIKECADEILKIYMLVDCLKKQILNKFYFRSRSKNVCPLKQNSALNSIQTQDIKEDKLNKICIATSKDVEVLCVPSLSKITDHSYTENGTYAETMTEELLVKDKDITACTENHDIGLNVSLPQISLRELGTQYTPKQLQDTGTVTDHSFKEKMSVATQNQEPMLIRVIKSNNSKGILKLDKETCVRDAHVLWMANIDKCTKNMYQKYSVREYYDKLLHSCVSHVHEQETNYIDYCTSPIPSGIYRYNKKYKANISNFGLSSNQHVSRIPLYVKSRKYTQRKNKLYKTSQSYA